MTGKVVYFTVTCQSDWCFHSYTWD